MKPRVLVIDDDRLVADTLVQIFKVNGFESEAVYSAAAGMERARTFAPELLLCDIFMPEESGLQLACRVQSELPGCKVLMISAYAMHAGRIEEEAKALQRPVKLLRKPCRPELLLEEASALLKTA